MSRPADGDPALRAQLAKLERDGLRRSLRTVEGPVGPRAVVDGRELLLLCTNDYLGLAGDARVRAAAARAAVDHGAGAGSSRLIAGTLRLHRELEDELARFEGTGGAVLFGAGFLANVGVVGALAQRGGIVGIGGDQRHVEAQSGAHLLQLRQRAARHRPVRAVVAAAEIFGDQAPGEAGRAIDDDVEFAHLALPMRILLPRKKDRASTSSARTG